MSKNSCCCDLQHVTRSFAYFVGAEVLANIESAREKDRLWVKTNIVEQRQRRRRFLNKILGTVLTDKLLPELTLDDAWEHILRRDRQRDDPYVPSTDERINMIGEKTEPLARDLITAAIHLDKVSPSRISTITVDLDVLRKLHKWADTQWFRDDHGSPWDVETASRESHTDAIVWVHRTQSDE